MPASINQVQLFLAYLFWSGLQPSTLLNYLSAISYYHKMLDLKDPTHTFPVQSFIQGAKALSPKPNQLEPVTLNVLRTLLESLATLGISSYNKSLFHAMMTLAYWGCFRIGELASSTHDRHTITRNQILVKYDRLTGSPTSVQVAFKSYKHSKGNTPTINIHKHSDRLLCPVRALLNYLDKRPNFANRPLFISLLGPTITRSHFVQILKQALIPTPFRHARINSHSFRVGRTTDLAMSGASDEYIRQVGRWKSNAFRKYVRPDVLQL